MSQADCWCRSNCIALSAVLLFLWHGRDVNCQELTGVITGQTVDQTDNVLPGTRVVITNLHSARVITVATEAPAHTGPPSLLVSTPFDGRQPDSRDRKCLWSKFVPVER